MATILTVQKDLSRVSSTLALFGALTAFGCGDPAASATGGDDSSSADDGPDEPSALEICSGPYDCHEVGSPTTVVLTLEQRRDGCYIGDIRIDVPEIDVRGNYHRFLMCEARNTDIAAANCIDCGRFGDDAAGCPQ